MPGDTKNEFEIWSKFNDTIADLIADKAQRLKRLSAVMQPPKGYTIGQYILDQTQNLTNLLQAYVDAAKSDSSGSGKKASAKTEPATTKPAARKPRKKKSR